MDLPTIDSTNAQIYRLECVDSTNTVAKELVSRGAVSGSIVVAERQTAGRGRLGRRWESPRGGLYFSYLHQTRVTQENLATLNIAVGLAIREVIGELCGLAAEVAWPNDVMVAGKKIAGVLNEYISSEEMLIVGIGINVNVSPDAMPSVVAKPATSVLIETQQTTELEKMIAPLQHSLGRHLVASRGDIESLYKEHAYWKQGGAVHVDIGRFDGEAFVTDRSITGTVVGLDFNTGHLLIDAEDGSQESLEVGAARIRAVQ